MCASYVIHAALLLVLCCVCPSPGVAARSLPGECCHGVLVVGLLSRGKGNSEGVSGGRNTCIVCVALSMYISVMSSARYPALPA